jgi:hypothetical protein
MRADKFANRPHVQKTQSRKTVLVVSYNHEGVQGLYLIALLKSDSGL